MLPALPAELVDHIFSFLPQEDTSALKACSKAHPLFSSLAERYLYKHVVIDKHSEVCNPVIKNPRLLDYPRTLEIFAYITDRNLLPIDIMSVIPRMANLVSLRIDGPLCPYGQRAEFFSMFRNCLHHSSFRELHLFSIFFFPFSILDDAKNIKKLTLSDCSAGGGWISSTISTSSQLSLDTLILSGRHYPPVHRWAARWGTRLTSLELHDLLNDLDWGVFPEVLAACSNSLTRLHLDESYRYSRGKRFPFILSPLIRLKRLSVFTLLSLHEIESGWGLREILRVVKTAPALQDVTLRFHTRLDVSVTSITAFTRLDWSFLDHLQSDLTDKRPHIDFCVTGEFGNLPGTFCPESALDALAGNVALMDLVKRGLVTLRSEHPLPKHYFFD